MKPVSSGYADVNGIKLYHEIYGEGEPLVLIHGGRTTTGRKQGRGQSRGNERWGNRPQRWAEAQGFQEFPDKMGNMMGEDYDWSADIAKLPMPVLLVFADNDSVSQKHIAEFFALLGGGVREPGWLNTQLSKSRLAVGPGYSHYNFIRPPEAPPIIGRVPAEPGPHRAAGAAAPPAGPAWP